MNDDKLFDLTIKMYEEMQEMKNGMERLEGKVNTLSNQFTYFENNMGEKLNILLNKIKM